MIDPLIKQALAILLAEVAKAEHGPVGRQNDVGANPVPHRVAVHFEFLDAGDVYIADPRYLALDPPKLVLRPWIKDEDGVIIGETHNVQKLRVNAASVGSIIGIANTVTAGGGGAGLAISLLQQYLAKKAK